ncbi:uncharacterized protein LOC106143641 [Amyelois transitella]|uniref:uncharacterized protein LOC106143641 n=1 Tax=Amyelois transitella TaxID=680683 RepID=UPI00299009A6|nr:uncharacterized protein LOC106143641 [Amyelois transitella]
MEALLNIQNKLKQTMKKTLVNFMKYPQDKLSPEYIETRLENLERDWSLYRENDLKLYSSLELENSDNIRECMYDDAEEIYVECKTHMKLSLKKLSSAFAAADSHNSHVRSSASSVKLPKICIPTFSGNYLEWATFRSMFVSLVHNNREIDNIHKLYYLKGHLIGEAEQLLRHIPITDVNYIRCWELLERRYNNKKYLINHILRRLLNQKTMHKDSSILLKNLLDTTIDCLSALRNLDVDVDSWDIFIIHIVSEKLDTESRKQWELSSQSFDSNELPSFQSFKSFIEQRFRALEFVEIEPKNAVQQPIECPANIDVTSMLATKKSKMQCEYCSQLHKLCFCKKFAKLSLEGRQNFVVQNKICINCLGSNHNVNKCKKLDVCKICHARHHSLLHNVTFSVNNHKNTKPHIKAGHIFSKNGNNYELSDLHSNRVILPTALVYSKSSTGEIKTSRALIDQGSQCSFVTEDTVRKLGLKKFPVRECIGGLGNSTATKVNHMVKLTIGSRVDLNCNLHISAYVLDNITTLPQRNINANFNNFNWMQENGLQLADSMFNEINHRSNKIDLLLGANIYSSIIKPGIIKSPTGSMLAQNTVFGWIISGT